MKSTHFPRCSLFLTYVLCGGATYPEKKCVSAAVGCFVILVDMKMKKERHFYAEFELLQAVTIF